jgi:hypothetical protein
MLVADALRLGGAILGQYPNMLAPQLVSRLLPEIGPNPNVKMLLKQCDETGPEHCALLPLYHCLHTPGGPLKVSAICICFTFGSRFFNHHQQGLRTTTTIIIFIIIIIVIVAHIINVYLQYCL